MKHRVLIIGGSGFIGSCLVGQLLQKGHTVFVLCTNIDKAKQRLGDHQNLKINAINIFNPSALEQQIKSVNFVINLIGKLYEKKAGDFELFHNRFPQLLCSLLSSAQHLIHISALGINRSARTALYARSKLAGEGVISDTAKAYTIFRPSVVYGPGDNFFNFFAKLSKYSPVLPLVGGGHTLFAPIHVEDLVQGILKVVHSQKQYLSETIEAYGPRIASFKEILEFINLVTERKRLLLPLPFRLASAQAHLMNYLGVYLLTPDQVELLKYNSIKTKNHVSLETMLKELGDYEKIVPTYLK